MYEIAREADKNAMGTASQVKIFLSSTSIDLSEIRIEVSRWLTGIFGAELIIMETFGSDATSPDVNSVRRVRECDLFVGIYAHRYGTVDQATGKSITELELGWNNFKTVPNNIKPLLSLEKLGIGV